MREHFGCGRFMEPRDGPFHHFGPFGHGPRGPPPTGQHCGPHSFGHQSHGPFGQGPHCHGPHHHGPHRRGHHGHHGHRGHHGHYGHHGDHGHHKEFGFFGHHFWGPFGRFGHERPGGCREEPKRSCRCKFGRGPEERKGHGCNRRNMNHNGGEETVLVRGVVIERAQRPNSV